MVADPLNKSSQSEHTNVLILLTGGGYNRQGQVAHDRKNNTPRGICSCACSTISRSSTTPWVLVIASSVKCDPRHPESRAHRFRERFVRLNRLRLGCRWGNFIPTGSAWTSSVGGRFLGDESIAACQGQGKSSDAGRGENTEWEYACRAGDPVNSAMATRKAASIPTPGISKTRPIFPTPWA